MYDFADTTAGSVTGRTSASIQTIFNNTNLDESLTDNDGEFRTLAVSGRSNTTNRINIIGVTGMDGVYEEEGANVEPRNPLVKFRIRDETNEGFAERLTKLNALLRGSKKELEFADEDVTYYATVSALELPEEDSNDLIGTMTFLCSDPYKYGLEQTKILSDISTVENKGTAEADPIFELTATKKTTFAMVSNGNDEYNLIGEPAEVDEVVVNEKDIILVERGDTISQWTSTGAKIDGNTARVQGIFGVDGTGIIATDYGATAPAWHGPAVMKEIIPTQDFEVEMRLRAKTTDDKQVYRIEFYLFDENMNVLGKMAIVDNSANQTKIAAEGRYGDFLGTAINYPLYSKNYLKMEKHFHGMIRMRRRGQKFEFYVARTTRGGGETGKHWDQLTKTFIDAENEYQGKLKYVQIHMGKYGDKPGVSLPRINNIKVSKYNTYTEDQTPYILDVGDKVLFDHKNDDILINGEARNDLKNFGGSFFKLSKGYNNLIVTPENSFTSDIKFRDKYL